ncbi:amino acid-binding protein [Mycolicibacterium sp.]|uniref:amino acid-binding protein n=1 Tax=Mycolicibacterium sp. TaxID=2320850 RepID=UPI0028A6C418|nr:amino acid-binding protein [Mycolicibacterium sp.]
MRSYLLRVELEDRPGSLGSLAVALGSVGADILSLDVVERGPGYAIDDLVVDLPTGAMPDTVITAAEGLIGVRVESIRPHTGRLEAHRELELIDHVAAAGDRADKLQVLVDEAPRILRVGWCTVVEFTDHGPQRIVGSPGAPETQAPSTPWMPISQATALDASEEWVPQLWRDMDTTLAAAPLGGPHTAIVLGRPGGPNFRPSEVARLGYLAGIVASLLR